MRMIGVQCSYEIESHQKWSNDCNLLSNSLHLPFCVSHFFTTLFNWHMDSHFIFLFFRSFVLPSPSHTAAAAVVHINSLWPTNKLINQSNYWTDVNRSIRTCGCVFMHKYVEILEWHIFFGCFCFQLIRNEMNERKKAKSINGNWDNYWVWREISERMKYGATWFIIILSGEGNREWEKGNNFFCSLIWIIWLLNKIQIFEISWTKLKKTDELIFKTDWLILYFGKLYTPACRLVNRSIYL